MKPHSLQFKFLTFMLLLTVLLGVLSGWYASRLSRDVLEGELIERGKSLAKSLAYTSKYGLFTEDPVILKDLLDGVMEENYVDAARVYNESGNLLAERVRSPSIVARSGQIRGIWSDFVSSQGEVGVYRLPPTLSGEVEYEIWAAIETKGSIRSVGSPSFEDFLNVRPKELAQKRHGAAMIGISSKRVDEGLKPFLRFIVILTGLIIVVGSALSIYFTRRILHPIGEIARSATEIAEGNLRQRIEVTTQDEVGSLIRLFNRMVDALRERDEKLQTNYQELQKVNQLLQVQAGELEAFVYTVSHDLKSPLVTQHGYATLLVNSLSGRIGEKERHYLDRIIANAEQMEQLIKDLLELSRIGRVKGPLEELDVSKIIGETFLRLEGTLGERKIEFLPAASFPKRWGDRVRLEQIFLNLIGNAVKFTANQPSPKIEVGVLQQNGQEPEFFVRDNGIGIDAAHHERIFEIFQRLNEIQSEGTGIGLALVKRAVEEAGGKIRVA